MAAVTKYRNGVPSWADVAVVDIAKGTEFYTSLFGWDAEDMGEDAGHYTMFSSDGKSVAALGPKQGEGAPMWNAYISVDDLDATISKVEAAGGSIVMPKMEVFTSGSMAIIADATGAIVSLWQPGDHIGAELVNVPNTLSWHELTNRDPGSAMKFYGDVLGWEFQEMPPDTEGGAPGYRMVMVGERVVAGLMPMDGEEWGDLPSHWMVYFAVGDTDATTQMVKDLGGAVSVDPFDMGVGRMAVVNDPEGNAFSIITFGGEVDTIDGGTA